MVIRNGTSINIYENSCPHRQLPLDFKSGKFLDLKNQFILCTNHMAYFQINNGVCIKGPCKGLRLKKINFRIDNNKIYIKI